MAYVKNNWVDRVVQYPNRYTDQNNVVYTFTRSTGTVTNEGTPITAQRMNNIENGIEKVTNDFADDAIHSTNKLNKDSNGIFTEIRHLREDGTLILKSVVSGGVSPRYTTRTETKYAKNGTTIEWTKSYSLSYDVDDELISEVIV